MKSRTAGAWRRALRCRGAIFLIAGLLTSCAATFNMTTVDKLPQVAVTPSLAVSADSTQRLEGTHLTLPGKVLEYAYHHPTRKILIRYMKGAKQSEFVLYDLAQQRAQWAVKSNAVISTLKETAAILHFQGPKVLDARDGRFLRDGEPGFWTTSRENVALSLTKDKYAGVNLLTGGELWQRAGNDCEGYRWAMTDSAWVYVVANGVQAFQLANGEGWAFTTSTSSKAVGKEVGKHVALGILGALTGTIPTAGWDPDLTHNLCSYPLVNNDRVYFAARDNVYCFEQKTGKVLWQTKLPQEPGTLIVAMAGPYVAVIGEGWKYRDYRIIKALPPMLALFDRNSGEPAGQFSTDTSDVFMDFNWQEKDAYFLTSKRLYHLDHQLKVMGMREAENGWGQFVRLLDSEKSVIARTANGIATIEANSLETIGHKKLGSEKLNVKFETDPKWREGVTALVIKTNERQGKWRQQDIEWLVSDKGLSAVDFAEAAKVMMEVPFAGRNFKVHDDGVLITFDEKQLAVVDLSAVKKLSQDMSNR